MRYIYLNNYRGFSDVVVPLAGTNFLVGENSTGKSSFLRLLNIFSESYFFTHPDYAFTESAETAVFDDLVSAWSEDRSFFEVGVFQERAEKGKRFLEASIYRFASRDGAPRLSEHIRLTGNALIYVLTDGNKLTYRAYKWSSRIGPDEDASAIARKAMAECRSDDRPFKDPPEGFPPGMPLGFLVEYVNPTRAKDKPIRSNRMMEGFHMTWIAPIRTAPKQFYGGARGAYSPEGEHTPYLLRQSLQPGDRSTQFIEKLTAFGNASGLFNSVDAHVFGEDPRAPFEILIKFSGASLSINNVGYGVSQALPLVVEFLSKGRPRRSFAVQQPEVHLHPRAQASLGDLMFELSYQQKYSFFVETHSDYLIDRYRLAMKRSGASEAAPRAQVIFFSRTVTGNQAEAIAIGADGSYPTKQPKAFREFFIREELQLLEL